MSMHKLATGLAAVLLSLGLVTAPASAAPMGPSAAAILAPAATAAEPVDYRPYRHCHWKKGRKWCHGPHYRSSYGPGVSIYIGKKPRYYKHRKYHHRKYHKRKRWN